MKTSTPQYDLSPAMLRDPIIFTRGQALNKPKQVATCMSRIINLVMQGKLDENHATKIIMMLRELARVLESMNEADIIARLEQIEQQLDAK